MSSEHEHKKQKTTHDEEIVNEDELYMDIDEWFVFVRDNLRKLGNNALLLTPEQCINYSTFFRDFWNVSEDENWIDVYQEIINIPSFNEIDIVKQYESYIQLREQYIMHMFILVSDMICAYPENTELKKIGNDVFRIFTTVHEIFQGLQAIIRAHDNYNEKLICASSARVAAAYFNQFDRLPPDLQKEQSNLAKFISFILKKCAIKSLTRQDNDRTGIYQTIFINGKNTYAYERVCSISEFIYSICGKDVSVDGFFMATKSNNMIDSAVKFIESMDNTYELPIVHRDRNIFSFRNGVYFAKHDMFFPYGNSPIFCPGEDSRKIEPISCRYIDMEFDFQPTKTGPAIAQIETPALESILDYQHYTAQHKHTFFAMLGKLLFYLREKIPFYDDEGKKIAEKSEDWQVMMMLYGLRGTGKSKIVDTIQMIYNEHDYGNFSNKMRAIQGLEDMEKKYINVASDVTNNFWLDRGEWQKMVTGDPVTVQGMYKKGEMVRWKVPMIFACNENPYKMDPQGSIGRRQAIFQFNYPVKKEDIDTTLESKLRQELPNIILKAVRSYRWCVYHYGDRDFWHWTTPEMNQARIDMQIELNPWTMFLMSDMVECNPNYFVSFNLLCKQYKKFANERILDSDTRRNIRTTSESYSSSFADKGLKVFDLEESRIYPSEESICIHPASSIPYTLRRGTKIVIGIDIVDVDDDGN